jgi:hypothetical protein
MLVGVVQGAVGVHGDLTDLRCLADSKPISESRQLWALGNCVHCELDVA